MSNYEKNYLRVKVEFRAACYNISWCKSITVKTYLGRGCEETSKLKFSLLGIQKKQFLSFDLARALTCRDFNLLSDIEQPLKKMSCYTGLVSRFAHTLSKDELMPMFAKRFPKLPFFLSNIIIISFRA